MPAHTAGRPHLTARIWAHLRRRGYDLLFGLSILSLAALVAWWSVFIHSTIEQQHAYALSDMLTSAHAQAQLLGSNPDTPPHPGILAADERLEVIATADAGRPMAAAARPHWPELSVAPRAAAVAEVEREFHSKLVMVIGETSLLALVILVCSIMLHRMIRLERRAARELHDFWSRLTHEIKTPITGIKAFLQTIERQPMSHEKMKPLVKLALREAERQEMLAENLLVGQRMEKESFGMQVKAFDLRQYVADFLAEHRMILPDSGIGLAADCPAGTMVSADPDALRVILENLTDNALKYGGRDPRIDYRIAAGDEFATITIADRGIGFDPAHGQRIFEAYQRLTEELPEGKHGTGMGLYLSRRLARQMGGDLQAASAGRGQGARFTVTLRTA